MSESIPFLQNQLLWLRRRATRWLHPYGPLKQMCAADTRWKHSMPMTSFAYHMNREHRHDHLTASVACQ